MLLLGADSSGSQILPVESKYQKQQNKFGILPYLHVKQEAWKELLLPFKVGNGAKCVLHAATMQLAVIRWLWAEKRLNQCNSEI